MNLISLKHEFITLIKLTFKFDDPTKNHEVLIDTTKLYQILFVDDGELYTIVGRIASVNNTDDDDKGFFLKVDCSDKFVANVHTIYGNQIRDMYEVIINPNPPVDPELPVDPTPEPEAPEETK